MNSFLYSLADGWKGIFRNIMMSLVSMSMLAGSLLLVGSLAMVVVNIDAVIESVGDGNQIMIYLDEDATQEDINRVSEELTRVEHVDSFTFVSREQALELMRKDLEDYQSVLDGMEEDNPLRDGFEIQTDEPENIDKVASSVEAIERVASVKVRTDVVDAFIRTRNVINYISVGLMVLLSAVSLVIVMNTIKVSAYTRREEISIMHMVGATKGNIRLSFITEGVVVCLSGALVAFLTVGILYRFMEKAFSQTGFLQIIPFGQEAGWLLLFFAVTAVLIGCIASILSVEKYLKA